MFRSRLVALLIVLAAVGGCSGSGDDDRSATSQPSTASTTTVELASSPASSTTLPWGDQALEGNLIDVRPSDCSNGNCPLGIATLADVSSEPGGERTGSGVQTQIAITDETVLVGCGPTDGSVFITFDELVDSMAQVEGEIPASVWVVDGVDTDAAELVPATQVVSGSCG